MSVGTLAMVCILGRERASPMGDDKPTGRAIEAQSKDTHFQLRIARELLRLAAIEAAKDHRNPCTKPSLSRWIRDCVAAELKRRGVLK
jgi:hypothetical protein